MTTNYAKPGRASTKTRARHVEDQPCSSRGEGATHLLIHYGPTVRCCGCGVPWSELDEALNGSLSSRLGLT